MPTYQVLTYTPIRNPLSLRPDINEYSTHYRAFIDELAQHIPEQIGGYTPLGITQAHKRYDDLSKDSVECRLFTIEKYLAEQACTLTFHCYPGGVAVIETVFEIAPDAITEQDTIARSHAAIEAWLPDLLAWFGAVQRWDAHTYKFFHGISRDLLKQLDGAPSVLSELTYWTSRCLLINPADLTEAEPMLRGWLANTGKADEVDALMRKERQFSMHWLNYVIIGEDLTQQAQLRDTMRVAQYFYTARQRAIEMLQAALAQGAELRQQTRASERLLKAATTFSRANDIYYRESIKYFTQAKRQRVEAILSGWQFAELAESIHTLEDLCQNAIQSVQRQQQYRSSIYTDLILVFIGFLTILELVVALSAYSREFVLRPTLSYLDSSYSAVLSFIAWINTDVLMLSGLFTVLGLLGLYSYVKLK